MDLLTSFLLASAFLSSKWRLAIIQIQPTPPADKDYGLYRLGKGQGHEPPRG